MDKRFSVRAKARQVSESETDEGQALVEYSLILVLIVIVCFAIVTTMSDTINEKFFQIVQTMP